jgi:hypothetical protein
MTRNQLRRSIDQPQRFSDVADGSSSKCQATLYETAKLAKTYVVWTLA